MEILGRRVLVKLDPVKKEEVTGSGIVLTSSMASERRPKNEGEVISYGKDVNNGSIVPGVRIMFERVVNPAPIMIGEDTHMLVMEEDISLIF